MEPIHVWIPKVEEEEEEEEGVEHNYKFDSTFCCMVAYHVIFYISKEVTEINMEEVSRSCNHDIVVMTITNTLY